ncbi:PLD nuclease N-terminal domain-containing protein [Nocardioides sp. Kera G14]|uniref:PLD nuclease N-terminal domain-containing protein n=1 Tax=Nocardioides sp. Kera G14 TaxID=2884264 RepID=UPI001D12BB4F|nr:PLD nuclease N-terminal domain-containing protein [Nocardioides sp. Kera G14]UDY22875.1 PLD nuclease N-terminal domain-containing protein [Nocardioides sp. Kera G14]
MPKKSWSDLSPAQRAAIAIAGAAELVLTTYVGRDLVRRPPSSVRGPKALWALALMVQPVGPLAYLAAGRRSGQA